MRPREVARRDLIARVRDQNVVRDRARAGNERKTHLGVEAVGVLRIEVFLFAEDLGEIFFQIGIEHRRLLQDPKAVKARRGIGHAGKRRRRLPRLPLLLAAEHAGRQQAGRKQLLQTAGALLNPALNLGREAGDAGCARDRRSRYRARRLVVLQAISREVGGLEGVEGGGGFARAGAGANGGNDQRAERADGGTCHGSSGSTAGRAGSTGSRWGLFKSYAKIVRGCAEQLPYGCWIGSKCPAAGGYRNGMVPRT